jgi:hypothetical protein
MALKSEHDSPGTSSPEESDFVVQAINLEKDVLVDGAFEKALATSTCSTTSSPIVESASISESPFHSPKFVVGDVMSVTTVDEEESCKHQPDNSKDIKHSSDAQLEEVVELKEEIHCDVTLNEQSGSYCSAARMDVSLTMMKRLKMKRTVPPRPRTLKKPPTTTMSALHLIS